MKSILFLKKCGCGNPIVRGRICGGCKAAQDAARAALRARLAAKKAGR